MGTLDAISRARGPFDLEFIGVLSRSPGLSCAKLFLHGATHKGRCAVFALTRLTCSPLSCIWFCTAMTTACLTGFFCTEGVAASPAAASGVASVSAPTTATAKEKRAATGSAAAPIDFPAIVERYGPAV
ncbi:hypothetical protein ACFQLY_23030, partial [Paraburkholderia dipogonis]